MVIDFHSHSLPKMDDGSGSLEESIAMLERQAEQGIQTVVATPHFYAQFQNPKEFLQNRSLADKALQEVLEIRPDLPKVLVGAEVFYFSGISDSEILPQLTIGGGTCILIEMPQPPWTTAMYRELEAIRVKQGLIPIIAHVDRYIRPFRTHGIPERLAQMPVLVQANAEFFLNTFTRPMAMKLLREDKIQLLGSDCHNLTSRQPNLGEAIREIEKRLGVHVLNRIASNQNVALNDNTV